jgi:hypothetical protein
MVNERIRHDFIQCRRPAKSDQLKAILKRQTGCETAKLIVRSLKSDIDSK